MLTVFIYYTQSNGERQGCQETCGDVPTWLAILRGTLPTSGLRSSKRGRAGAGSTSSHPRGAARRADRQRGGQASGVAHQGDRFARDPGPRRGVRVYGLRRGRGVPGSPLLQLPGGRPLPAQARHHAGALRLPATRAVGLGSGTISGALLWFGGFDAKLELLSLGLGPFLDLMTVCPP
jgi:hypothetical protein